MYFRNKFYSMEKDSELNEALEHIRKRPGMYAGSIGNGECEVDALYSFIKEVINNSVDEFYAGYGDIIIVNVTDKTVSVRDFGRGIPLKDIESAVLNPEYKGETSYEKMTVGFYSGYGIKIVNALSSYFHIASFRNGKCSYATFSSGKKMKEGLISSEEHNGTFIQFIPDEKIFSGYAYRTQIIESIIEEYTYLHQGIRIVFNNTEYKSEKGLLGLFLKKYGSESFLYPPIYFKDDSIEIVFTHSELNDERILSCVNGHITRNGGIHAYAFKSAIESTFIDYFAECHEKSFKAVDIHKGLTGAISLWGKNPIFSDSFSISKLNYMLMDEEDNSTAIIPFVNKVIKKHLTQYLKDNPYVAYRIQKWIQNII